jgi:hypothetical protein
MRRREKVTEELARHAIKTDLSSNTGKAATLICVDALPTISRAGSR